MSALLFRLRAAWASWSLRLGGAMLLLYGAAGALVGIEVVALIVAWPLAIGVGLVMLVAGSVVTRRLKRQPRRDRPID